MTHLLSSSSICGTDVRNTQGEDLGEIKDMMIDPATGDVNYAVLSFGGILGLGDKYFAVPFERFSVDRKDEKLVLNVDKERLKEAPGFDKYDWPDFADPSFRKTVDTFYG